MPSPQFIILVNKKIMEQVKTDIKKTKHSVLSDWQAIIDTATDAIITAGENGRILTWNSAAEKIFNYEKEEVIGKPLDIIIPKRYRSMHNAGMKRITDGGAPKVIGKVVELSGVRKNGEEFPIELSLSTWTSDGNKYFGGIIRDISVRKGVEQQLIASENRFRSVMESANDAIINSDSKGNILSWNNAAERIFGYTTEEVTGKSLMIIIPDEFKQAHIKGMQRVTSGGEHHVIGKTVEVSGLHKDGHLIPIELSLSTWVTEDGRYFTGIIRDISERKLAEQLKEAVEVKFRFITETANDAIISANEEGFINFWNQTAEKIFGYTENEVLGLPLTIIIPDKYKAHHEKGIKRVANGGPHHVIGQTVELEGLHKTGRIIPIELSLSTWMSMNKRHFCGIIRDISERKKNEEALKNQRLHLKQKAGELKKLNKEVASKNEQLQALSNKLAKYLSRQVYTSIFEGKRDVKIESYRKKLTVFFSDIHGFTELTDRVESEVLTNVLNRYLNEMSKIAIDHGGTIDKYIGDAIMIFFGDPETLGEKQDAIACVKMALEMKQKLIELRMDWDAMGIATPLRIRMGINTGFCTVGNFGSEERLDYTIVGGPVNLASRLESAAAVDEILISGDTFSLIKDVIECEEGEELKVKGIAYPVKTYVVKGVIADRKKKNEQLKAESKGFNLSINFNELNYTEKLYARNMLEKALAKL
jgi:PAS domain S-box-containing protein